MQSAVITNTVSLGAVLSTARTLAGRTQEEASAAASVPRPYISALESGKHTMALNRLFRLLDSYGAKMYLEMPGES